MKALRFAAPAALAVLLVLDAASADTLSARFPQLATEVQTRLAALATPPLTHVQKKQKSALTKAGKPLAVDTEDLAKTIADEKSAVAALDAVFKTDATLSPMLDSVVAIASTDVNDFQTFVAARVGAMPAGSARTKANADLTSAAKSETAAAVATKTRAARLGLYAKALGALLKADALARKAALGDVVDQMEAFVGTRRLFAAAGTTSTATAIYAAGPNELRVAASFQSLGKLYNVAFRVDAPDVGSFQVSVAPDSTIFVDGVGQLPATSGSVQISTWDPTNQKAAGTFDVVYSNGTTTVHVTSGAFSFIDVQTQ